MTTASELMPMESTAERWETAVVDGNLERLQPAERLELVRRICEATGLTLESQPFQYLRLSGKLVLYARRDATDQLRRVHRVSVAIVSRETTDGVHVVTARATMPDGRTDESTGAVPVKGLQGDAIANALMKAETKAKRRVTLSICGLGMLDESEVESIPGAAPEPLALPAPTTPTAPTAPAERKAGVKALAEMARLGREAGVDAAFWLGVKEHYGVKASADLTAVQAANVIADLQMMIEERTAIQGEGK
jgi:hypothetical protein